MVLAPDVGPAALGKIEAHLSGAPVDTIAEPLEGLRRAIPAARSLPLLALLAGSGAGNAVLEYLDHAGLGVTVSPCR